MHYHSAIIGSTTATVKLPCSGGIPEHWPRANALAFVAARADHEYMEGIRYRRPSWLVMRFWKDDDDRDDDAKHVGHFWNQPEAVAKANRLNESNNDPAFRFEVIEVESSGIYPADENPPWIPDPERLIRRGYERPD